jgi:cell division protein FtsL
MAAAAAIRVETAPVSRKAFWTGTPEIYFHKSIDNSRLVKVDDAQRNREMRSFAGVLAFLFLCVFAYTWQHFKAIEYGYQIEIMKRELNGQTEINSALRLQQAKLRAPERIDQLARRMGLVPPQPGQVVPMDDAAVDAGAPVMASAAPVTVLAAR